MTLYQQVALRQNVSAADIVLRQGDVAMLVDFVPLRADEVMAVRPLISIG